MEIRIKYFPYSTSLWKRCKISTFSFIFSVFIGNSRIFYVASRKVARSTEYTSADSLSPRRFVNNSAIDVMVAELPNNNALIYARRPVPATAFGRVTRNASRRVRRQNSREYLSNTQRDFNI